YDYSVCKLCRLPCMRGLRYSESYAYRQFRCTAKSGSRLAKIGSKLLLFTCDAQPADQVNKSRTIAGYLLHSLEWRCRRDQPDERELTRSEPLLAFCVRANGKVSNQDPI